MAVNVLVAVAVGVAVGWGVNPSRQISSIASVTAAAPIPWLWNAKFVRFVRHVFNATTAPNPCCANAAFGMNTLVQAVVTGTLYPQ